ASGRAARSVQWGDAGQVSDSKDVVAVRPGDDITSAPACPPVCRQPFRSGACNRMTTTASPAIAPGEVHRLLSRHMLADGLDLVCGYEKSHGAWVHDSRRGREYLDFMTFFGSTPIGYNHPKMKDPEFLRVLARVAQLKPSLADVYTVEYAAYVETLARIAIPP